MRTNKKRIFNDIKSMLLKWGFSKKGLTSNTKGEWYLFSQILIIILHLSPPYPKIEYSSSPINIFLLIIGITISVQGLITTKNAFIDLGYNLTPLPYPKKGSTLIKNNSYLKLRHPLYKGLLLISLGTSILLLSLLHFFLLIVLTYILKLKSLKEEESLKIKFPEYENYIKEVPAIIKNFKYLDWRS